MSETDTYRIRPAGRLVLTIGRELIQDPYAAVVELVKNAYDADSRDVSIEFSRTPDQSGYSITVTDHGHGMTREDVVNKWMVPSTADKLRRKRSPSGRIMQGRKGVGRYAAAILGTDLLLETISPQGERTTVYLHWQDFEESEYLDNVEILIETSETSQPPGTRLIMRGDDTLLGDWDRKQFDKLRFELRRLKSPVETALNGDDFLINLKVSGFPDADDFSGTIDPYPIMDLFDYRIAGRIAANGVGSMEYSMQKIRNSSGEVIPFDLGHPTNCGELLLDIRVYDRDHESIKGLIGRGLRNDSGAYLGNLDARRLLNDYNGIGVYRNGFRIRPLGDPDFDWLKLNEQRVQQPSIRIGSNQAIGFVQIQSDEQSGLIEKSARDGLRDNKAFASLKDITKQVIAILERRRFRFRRESTSVRPGERIQRELDRVISHDELRRDVQAGLGKSGATKETTEQILEIISQDEKEKNQIVDDIRQRVAIYEGQATLGKIVNVILHEGRRPLSFFRNEIPNLRYWQKSYLKTQGTEDLKRVTKIAEGIGDNAEYLVDLFSRVEPLAARKRGLKKSLNLRAEIEGALSVFRTTMMSSDVTGNIDCPDGFRFPGWSEDIHGIFTNLIDNSLYWLSEKRSPERIIEVHVVTDGKSLIHIDYRDTGPGIDPDLIASGIIFEPQFSTKPYGTGLGLPLAGEAATRNDLELLALESETGAWFRLQPIAGAETEE